jgi:hypothetical protein
LPNFCPPSAHLVPTFYPRSTDRPPTFHTGRGRTPLHTLHTLHTFNTFPNFHTFHTYSQDVVAIETVATINAGFCDYHVRHCPPSRQLVDECKTVRAVIFGYFSGIFGCFSVAGSCDFG